MSQSSVEFLDSEEDIEQPFARLHFPRRGRVMAVGGITVVAVMAASLGPHSSKAEPSNDRAASLITSHTVVYRDSGPVYGDSHELVEMLCSFKRTSVGLQPAGVVDINGYKEDGYTDPTRPFAVQLAHPTASNQAIIYTGIGTDIYRLQHFIVHAYSDGIHLETDRPEVPGDESSTVLSENIPLGDGFVTEGKSGLVRYAVGKWGGKFVVALACNRNGAERTLTDELATEQKAHLLPWDVYGLSTIGS